LKRIANTILSAIVNIIFIVIC